MNTGGKEKGEKGKGGEKSAEWKIKYILAEVMIHSPMIVTGQTL